MSDIVAKIRAEKNSNIDTLILEASNVEISNNIGLIIPVGTTSERESVTPRTGAIRFNSSDTVFEGYDGTNWGTLGGVKDVAQTTFIRAETSPGANNKQLDFITDNTQRMQIDSNGDFKFGDINTITPDIKFSINYDSGEVGAIKIKSQNIISYQITVNNLLSTQNISAENIIPKTDNIYNLGDSNNKWKQIFLDNSGINIGGSANIIRKTDGTITMNNNNGGFEINSDLSINENLKLNNALAINNNYGQPGEFLKSNGSESAISWEKPKVPIFLSFPVTDKVSTKQTIIFPTQTTLNKNNIIAELDNPPKIKQVYTFGKSIPNLWVAVGEGNNTIAYSNNGIDWTGLGKSIFSNKGFAVAYNGTMWVAVGNGTNNTMAYSYNGFDWTGLGTSIFTTQGNDVAYNGKMWVAVGTGNFTIATSTDGINWVGVPNSTNIFTLSGFGIAWNGTMWVAVGEGINDTIARSSDGINWYGLGNNVFTSQGNDVAYNGKMWVAVGRGSFTIATSTDGINWNGVTDSYSIFNDSGNGIEWNGTIWVAVGQGSNSNSIAYSYNGFDWIGLGTSRFSSLNSGLTIIYTSEANDVAYNGNMWVAIGGGIINMAYSYNGTYWFAGNTNIFTMGFGIAYNGTRENSIIFSENRIVATGQGTNSIIYSNDGITWTDSSNGNSIFPLGNAMGVAWNGKMWVAMGSGVNNSNTIAYSYDGIEWVGLGKNIFNSQGYSVAWGGNTWVAVGIGGFHTMAHSTNGIDWTGLGTSIFTMGFGIAYNGTMWVATGVGTYNIAYSYNGTDWHGAINSTSIFSIHGRYIAYGGSIWVATGDGLNNTMAYSSDGINWYGLGKPVFSNLGNDIAYNGTMWVAVGQGNNTIATSTDGINWTGVSNSYNIFSSQGIGISWVGNMWVATGEGINSIAYSYNGTDWTGVSGSTNKFSTRGYRVAWNAGIPDISMNTITLNKPNNKLDIINDKYFNEGFQQLSLTITI